MSGFEPQGGLLTTPVSVGEVVDKITILRIKAQNISDEAKLVNVRRELLELEKCLEQAFPKQSPEMSALADELFAVNSKLWQIEDDIRDCERSKDFGSNFVELARSVYFTNDKRAELKKQINLSVGSVLIEEKSYQEYR